MTEPTARLIDTGPICYVAYDGHRLVWRPCRTWTTAEGQILSVVTEIGDDGPSVTNAAEQVHATLQEARPGCRVIEHYPADSIAAEHFDEILVGPDGSITWRHIPTADLRALLGNDLDTTRPAGPVENGTWPTTTEKV